MTRHLLPLLTLLALACSHPPEQLESAQLQISGVENDWEDINSSGVLHVSGADRDWVLSLDSADPMELELHSPTLADLSSLDGSTVSVQVSGFGARNLLISDASGPAFLSQNGGILDQVDQVFGPNFADWGQNLHQELDGSIQYTFTQVDLQTDDGVVSVDPAVPTEIMVNGQIWSITVIAAYTVRELSPIMVACGGPAPVLAFEAKRVDGPLASLPDLQRPEGMDMARLGCGAF